MERTHIRAPRSTRRMSTEIHEDSRTQRVRTRSDSERAAIAAELAELDEILDEIDAVLEQNAEEFVKSYEQAGGE